MHGPAHLIDHVLYQVHACHSSNPICKSNARYMVYRDRSRLLYPSRVDTPLLADRRYYRPEQISVGSLSLIDFSTCQMQVSRCVLSSMKSTRTINGQRLSFGMHWTIEHRNKIATPFENTKTMPMQAAGVTNIFGL